MIFTRAFSQSNKNKNLISLSAKVNCVTELFKAEIFE